MIDDVTMKNLDLICDHSDLQGIMHFTFCLLKKIQKQVKLAYDDILFAAVKRPVFGMFLICCCNKEPVARSYYPD